MDNENRPMAMKAISLWQPYASLIAWGEKQYETRSWATDYRGEIVIHAGKNREVIEDLTMFFAKFYDAGRKAIVVPDHLHHRFEYQFMLAAGRYKQKHNLGKVALNDLPLGAAVAVATLVDCIPADRVYPHISSQERAFGGYLGANRYAWRLENVRSLDPVVPMRGKQALFDCELQ